MNHPSTSRRTPAWITSLLLAGLLATPAAAAERVAVGAEAPAFTLAPAGGAADTAAVELAALKGKKRALLVFFRGAW